MSRRRVFLVKEYGNQTKNQRIHFVLEPGNLRLETSSRPPLSLKSQPKSKHHAHSRTTHKFQYVRKHLQIDGKIYFISPTKTHTCPPPFIIIPATEKKRSQSKPNKKSSLSILWLWFLWLIMQIFRFKLILIFLYKFYDSSYLWSNLD